MPTDTPPPRRKWHLARWFIVFIVATLAWSGWRAYAFRSALSQAKALGWQVRYTDPNEEIRKDWKAAFRKDTWLDGVTWLSIDTGQALERHCAIVHRLNPKALNIKNAASLRDLSALKPLIRLQKVSLYHCTELNNVDALKNLVSLQRLEIDECTALTSIDAIKNLSALRIVYLHCTGLTNIDALKNLSALDSVSLLGCAGLTNVDALKNLSALNTLYLVDCTGLKHVDALISLSKLEMLVVHGCTGLTSVDALKNLSALKQVVLRGCTGLPKESVAVLRAALPNANIIAP